MQSTVMYGEFKQVFNFTPAPKEVAGVNLTEKETRIPSDQQAKNLIGRETKTNLQLTFTQQVRTDCNTTN